MQFFEIYFRIVSDMVEASELMSIIEVAQAKGITVGRVYQLINEGTLPATKIGNHQLVTRTDCDALIIHGKAGRPPKAKE